MQKTLSIEDEQIQDMTLIVKAMAHPVRLGVLLALDEYGALSVKDMCEMLEVEQSLLSHYLSQMRQARMIDARRQGKHIYYVMTFKNFKKLFGVIQKHSKIQ